MEVFAADYARGEPIEPHQHATAQIVFAKRGIMRVRTEAGAWVVPPQRAVLREVILRPWKAWLWRLMMPYLAVADRRAGRVRWRR